MLKYLKIMIEHYYYNTNLVWQGGTPSLKKLAVQILGIEIQEKEHNSVSKQYKIAGNTWTFLSWTGMHSQNYL